MSQEVKYICDMCGATDVVEDNSTNGLKFLTFMIKDVRSAWELMHIHICVGCLPNNSEKINPSICNRIANNIVDFIKRK